MRQVHAASLPDKAHSVMHMERIRPVLERKRILSGLEKTVAGSFAAAWKQIGSIGGRLASYMAAHLPPLRRCIQGWETRPASPGI